MTRCPEVKQLFFYNAITQHRHWPLRPGMTTYIKLTSRRGVISCNKSCHILTFVASLASNNHFKPSPPHSHTRPTYSPPSPKRAIHHNNPNRKQKTGLWDSLWKYRNKALGSPECLWTPQVSLSKISYILHHLYPHASKPTHTLRMISHLLLNLSTRHLYFPKKAKSQINLPLTRVLLRTFSISQPLKGS